MANPYVIDPPAQEVDIIGIDTQDGKLIIWLPDRQIRLTPKQADEVIDMVTRARARLSPAPVAASP